MKKPKISVVVPIYNVDKYLERCLDSIILQSYTNLEIILVNDGSTDRSSKICEEYALKDKRIKVIHKTNGGLSDARNTGIAIASARYISFIDSDDYIEDLMIEKLYKSLINYEANIATCQYMKIYENGDQIKNNMHSKNQDIVLSGEDAVRDLLYEYNTSNSACAKLYEIKLFSNIIYPVGCKYEDLGTTYKLFSKSKTVVITNYYGYYYYQRVGSIVNSKFDSGRMDGLKFAKEQLRYTKKYHPNITDAAKHRLFNEAIKILLSINDTNVKNKVYEADCLVAVNECKKSVLCNTNSNFKTKVYAAITFIDTKLLVKILSLRAKSLKP